MKIVKRCLLALMVILLLPAALLWIAGEGTKGKSLVQALRAFLGEFTSSRGFAVLAAAVSVAVYYECVMHILRICE